MLNLREFAAKRRTFGEYAAIGGDFFLGGGGALKTLNGIPVFRIISGYFSGLDWIVLEDTAILKTPGGEKLDGEDGREFDSQIQGSISLSAT